MEHTDLKSSESGASASGRENGQPTEPASGLVASASSLFPLLFALLSGIALSLIAFLAVGSWEQHIGVEMRLAEFQEALKERETAVRRELDQAIDAARDVEAFMAIAGESSLPSYSERILAQHPVVQTLAWIPRIEAGVSGHKMPAEIPIISERNPKGRLIPASADHDRFPLHYLASRSRQRPDAGFDIGTEPAYREAMEQVLQSGRLALTGKLPQRGPDWPGYDVAVLAPVFQFGGVPPTLEERRQQLRGFILAGYRLDKLMARALSGMVMEPIDLWLVDEPSAEPLYRPYSARPGATPPGTDDPQVLTKRVDAPNRNWLMVASPQWAEGPPLNTTSRWLVLAGGVGLTLLVVWYLAALRRQADDLVASNEALNRAVTEHRRTEVALRASESRFRKILETAADAILIVDSAARIVVANQRAAELFGYDADEFAGMAVHELVPTHHQEAHRRYHRAFIEHPEYAMGPGRELTARRKDGTAVPVEINLSPLRSPEGLFITAIIRDITERREAEKTRERLSAMLEATTDFAAMADARSGRLVYINAAGRKIIGLDPAVSVTDTTIEDYLTPESWDQVEQQVLPTASEKGVWSGELTLASRDGAAVPVSIVVLVHRDLEGKPEHFSAIARDISESKRTEAYLHRINRTHAVLSACNQALVRAASEEELLRTFCNNLVQVGGYRFTWVGFVSEDGPEIRPACQAGLSEGYLDEITVTCDETANGQGPVGTAVRTGSPSIVRDVASDSNFLPWAKPALERGYQSVISLPLDTGDDAPGTLSIYAGERDSFDEKEVVLLSELAADLAFGIRTFRSGEARYAAETGLLIRNRALEVSRNGVFIADASRDGFPLVYVNPAFEKMTGFSSRESLGKKALFLRTEERDLPELQKLTDALKVRREGHAILRNYRSDGSLFWNEFYLAPVYDNAGDPTHYVGVLNDITEHKRYEEELEYQSQHDELTGLPNRNLLQDRIDQALVYATRYHRAVAVLFLDLDQFKVINDTLGHRIGDELLKVVAQRLLKCGRDGDTVARYGGDEFVFLLPDLNRLEDVNSVADRILGVVSEPVELEEHRLETTISIGATIFPRDGSDSVTLLKNADAAMYRAKELGRDSIHFYTEDLNTRLMERLTLERQLRRGIEQGELVLHYQPQVDLMTGLIKGMEALVRWQHPDLGMVSPDRFIPLAEETGLIVPLGDWVLQRACEQNKAWQALGLPPVSIAVNLSARQLGRGELFRFIRRVLKDTGLRPRYLELELTESSVMEDPVEMLAKLRRLKDLGVSLSIDDFGTGYSSLSQLKRFPFDKLKIDQSFVRDVTSEPDDAAIAVTIIGMAKSLNLQVIAEGVETEGQLRYLMRHGCNEVQGYLFSRPQPAEAIEKMLRERVRFELPEQLDAPAVLMVLGRHGSERVEQLAKADANCSPLLAESTDEAFELLARKDIRVVVTEQYLSGMAVTEFLRRIGQLYPGVNRLLIAEHKPGSIIRSLAEQVLVAPDGPNLKEAVHALCVSYQRTGND